jgi:hypothetical protein
MRPVAAVMLGIAIFIGAELRRSPAERMTS